MGRKKQKVRWTTLEEGFFNQPDQEYDEVDRMSPNNPTMSSSVTEKKRPKPTRGSVSPQCPESVNDDDNVETGSNHGSTTTQTSTNSRSSHNHYYAGSNRNYGPKTHYQNGPPPPRRYNNDRSGVWVSAPLAPRFERNKALVAAAAAANGSHNGYYRQNSVDCSVNGDVEIIEGEDLPNGFTKIRSKNLDVLFKKDYYATTPAQKLHTNSQSSNGSSENGEDSNDASDSAGNQSFSEEPNDDVKVENEENKSEDKDKTKKLTINTDASPFYPRAYQQQYDVTAPSFLPELSPSSQAPPSGVSPGGTVTKPNLFLYSPASNTIIPCDEIMIPNHNTAAGNEDVSTYPSSNLFLTYPTADPAPATPSTAGTGSPPAASFVNPPQFIHNPLVHYDQFGVPYTSYLPPFQPPIQPQGMAVPATQPPGQQQPVLNNEPYQQQTPESTSPLTSSSSPAAVDESAQSPPDLSMYSPANWVVDSHQQQMVQQQQIDANKKTSSLSIATTYTPQQVYYQYQQQQQQQQPRNGYGMYNNHQWYANSSASSTEISPQQRRGGYHSYSNMGNKRHHHLNVVESSTVPSSSADSMAEDRSEEDEMKSKPKEDVQDTKPFIPGLNADRNAAHKRVQKKRRKKKNAAGAQVVSTGAPIEAKNTVVEKQVAELKHSSSSEDLYPANNKLIDKAHFESEVDSSSEAIVSQHSSSVLKQDNFSSVCSSPLPQLEREDEAPTTQDKMTVDEGEKPIKAVTEPLENGSDSKVAQPCDSKPDEKETPKKLYSAVVSKSEVKPIKQKPQPSKQEPPVHHHKKSHKTGKVGGKRHQESNPGITEDDSHQWEAVPIGVIEAGNEGWEVSGKMKRNRKHRSGQKLRPVASIEDNFYEEEKQAELTEAELVTQPSASTESEPAEPPVKESTTEETLTKEPEEPEEPKVVEDVKNNSAPTSLPVSRKSTLKKPKKKRVQSAEDDILAMIDKLPTLIPKSSTTSNASQVKSNTTRVQTPTYPTSVRPVLIQDGILDVAASSAHYRKVKRASEVFDQSRIAQAVQKGHVDTLIISDIGHGMCDGPISMGRFGIGKYSPPDRSDEILPMQKKLLEEAEAKAQENNQTIIKVMMGEVVTTSEIESKITEITCDEKSEAEEKCVQIPDDILPLKKSSDLDLD